MRRLHRVASRADLIHCHGFRAAVVAAPLSRRLVVTPHGSHIVRRTHGPRRWLALASVRAVARRASVVICVGREELHDLQGVLGRRDARKLRLVLNGSSRVAVPTLQDKLDARRAFAIDEAAPVLAYVGRLEPHKEPLLALRSFERTLERLPSARLLLAGDGSLSTAVRELDVDHVHHLGHVDDCGPVLVAADAILNTSRWEGVSLSLLEALWRGRPAVAVAAAGNQETIGDTGVLVDSRDPRAIGEAAAALLGNPDRLASLGARARQRAEVLFDEERMVEQTLDLYEECMRDSVWPLPDRVVRAGVAPR